MILPDPRRLAPGRLVIATHNPGKVVEIGELLAPFGMDLVSAGDLGLAEPEETGATFRANAELKALAAAMASGLPSLADDSGLCVDALGGDPGIYSARWAGAGKDFRSRRCSECMMVLRRTEPGHRAFHLRALPSPGPTGIQSKLSKAALMGGSAWPPRGRNGFGYDPMFVMDDAKAAPMAR